MYAMTATWPDIAYAIRVLSWYNHDLSNEYMIVLKHVFRYLNGRNDWCLHCSPECALGCCFDWDYAGCLEDFKSTSALVIPSRGAVDWRLRKQKSTAQSTTDSEYYAFGVGSLRLTPIFHLSNKHAILNIRQVFLDAHSLIHQQNVNRSGSHTQSS
jgi:hypothetical protein